MRLDGILQYLIPKDKKFFPLFEQATANLLKTSETLYSLADAVSPERRKEIIREIERLEHVGDNFTHMIYNELDTNFITPFDREDIHELASVIDDVVDLIHGSAKRIDLYKIGELSVPMIKLSELIMKGSQELNVAVCNLRNMKDLSAIKEACVKIHSLENHADEVFNNGIARLFEEEKDPMMVIKLKEILATLETATDKLEDAADVIHSILIKTS
jgi:predicted phosphate transport protein (TIGR00153 family)